jgi:hypothetical protein
MRSQTNVIFAALLAFTPMTPALMTPALAQDATPPMTQQPAAPIAAQISVTGTGTVQAAPDMATISLGVTQTADTAKGAMDQTNAELARVLANMKAAGIDARDLQTSGLSLQPTWDAATNTPSTKSFTASNQVTVTVRALDTLGGVLDAAVKDGANTLNNVQFGVSDPAPLLDEARLRAVADARHRADVMVNAAGVRLGAITQMSEQGGGMVAPRGEMMMRASADAVPVQAGELAFSVNVAMTWQLLQ